MSELLHQRQDERLRRNLLTGVSALAMVSYVVGIPAVLAASSDEDRPTVWIELGGQLERTDSAQSIFAPPFFDIASKGDRNAMTGAQRPSRYAIGGEGKVTFEPEGTNWVFSAAVRYGRSNSSKHQHHETPGLPIQYWTVGGAPFVQYTPAAREFGDGQVSKSATHLVLDFLAGKDVGLGMFGSRGSSVISAGVRFAQFTSKADVTLHARPVNDVITKYNPGAYRVYFAKHRTYTAFLHTERNSHAIGPSVSWDASAIIASGGGNEELTLDLGANAAILFGRQRAKTHHQTKGAYHTGLGPASASASSYTYTGPSRARTRTVAIPNVGGFAGLSLRFPNAKVSLGYRGDFFFGATDSGNDTRHETAQKFYGPFAAISIGLGN